MNLLGVPYLFVRKKSGPLLRCEAWYQALAAKQRRQLERSVGDA